MVSQRDQRGPYVIELNLQHIGGLEGASAALRALHDEVLKESPAPVPLAKTYFTWRLSVEEWRKLLLEDDRHALRAHTRPRVRPRSRRERDATTP